MSKIVKVSQGTSFYVHIDVGGLMRAQDQLDEDRSYSSCGDEIVSPLPGTSAVNDARTIYREKFFAKHVGEGQIDFHLITFDGDMLFETITVRSSPDRSQSPIKIIGRTAKSKPKRSKKVDQVRVIRFRKREK